MEYEVYFTGISGCDDEWELLGRVQADSEPVAREEASKRWPDYPSEYVVCVSVDTLFSVGYSLQTALHGEKYNL